MPKILIATPTFQDHDYCLNRFISTLKNLIYKDKDILIVDNSKENNYFEKLSKINLPNLKVLKDNFVPNPLDRIVSSRNIIREFFLKNNYNYLLFLDQDVIPPLNVIEQLLSHKKEIISGVYHNYFTISGIQNVILPVIYTWANEKDIQHLLKNQETFKKTDPEIFEELKKSQPDLRRQLSNEEVKENKLIKIRDCGLGCLLISKNVLGKIKFSLNEKGTAEDLQFCKDARALNFEIFCDTSVKCSHLIKQGIWEKRKKEN